MDSRGTERLSLAAQSDGDRRVATSILLTMAAALVVGTSAGVLMILSGPEITTLTLTLMAVVMVAGGLVGVQMVHVRMLEEPSRWVPVLMVDYALAGVVAVTLLLGFIQVSLLVVAAFTVHSIGRAISLSAAMIESWEIEVDDSRVRFRRMVFSRPMGPWHSVGLEDARARVLQSGRDWFLEVGGIALPVGPADEQARMLADRIEQAAGRFRDFADDDREEDREAVRALSASESAPSGPRTLVPWRVEARSMIFVAPWLVGLAFLTGPALAAACFGIAVLLRTAVWLWARRLRATPRD